MRGLFGQLYREDNVLKVRRGMTGLIKKGLTAGGRAYGYRPDPAQPGRPKIVESEAAIVRHIYERYNTQHSPSAICHELNARGAIAPRGKRWMPSALTGDAKRGSGILRNPVYCGRLVWNKVRMIKDPQTGKRISRPNAEAEWQIADVPELRIIADDLFDAVQHQIGLRATAMRTGGLVRGRRPKHLLTGILKCGACGFGMQTSGKDRSGRIRLKCTSHVQTKNCPQPKSYYLDLVEKLFLRSLHKHAGRPELLRALATASVDAPSEALARHRITELKIEIAKLDESIKQLLDWMLRDLVDAQALGEKTKEHRALQSNLCKEMIALEEKLAGTSVDGDTIAKLANSAAQVRKSRKRNGVEAGDFDRARIREAIQSVTVCFNPTVEHNIELVIRCRLVALQSRSSEIDRPSLLMLSGRQGLRSEDEAEWKFDPDVALIQWTATY